MTDQPQVRDNREAEQFEITVEGETAFLAYERSADSLVLIHTEVPVALRGHHLGEDLVKAALAAGAAEHLRIVVVCPFVKAYLRKHPEAASGQNLSNP
jgi:predicted GNAT family acetyltransferase